MANLRDLDLLARFWPVLFGKALDPEGVLGVQGLVPVRSGRPDRLDEQSPEIQAALRGLDRLYEMHEQPAQRQAAQVLLYSRVKCGNYSRVLGEVYLSVALAYAARKPKTLTEEKRKALINQGRKLYDIACSMYQMKRAA